MKGDNCLRDIGDAFLKLANDDFRVFRFGGEEFLIIGIDVTENEMLDFAQSVVTEIEDLRIPRDTNSGFGDHITISIGCALSAMNSQGDYNKLLEDADRSLYYAKRNGKNCYAYQEQKYTV